jgi:hypothetical protein
MTSKSNDQGRAFEYVFLKTLEQEIGSIRPTEVIENSAYKASQRAWETINLNLQETLEASAAAAVPTLFDLEPLILDDGRDVVEIKIQTDHEGEEGDVRDILITRENICWEIGLSLKHNHFAVKHSRLSGKIDFLDKWVGVPCSSEYWDRVSPIFEYLTKERDKNTDWHDLPQKEEDVYIPLLSAFIDEVLKADRLYEGIPTALVEYLLGYYDFYKVISEDRKQKSQIQAFNLRGTLNQPSRHKKPSIVIPLASLPTRIVALEMKPDSTNTAELYMDGGWQFSFRIHNASTKVEPSLKFDIQIIGMPITIVSIDCRWRRIS